MIRFNCHRCGMLIQAADSGAGRHAKCPGCGLILDIPEVTPAVPTPPPPPVSALSPPVSAPPPVPPVPPSAQVAMMQAAMPVPPAGTPAPGALLLDEFLRDTSPPPRPPSAHVPTDSPAKKSSAASSGGHKLSDSGKMNAVKASGGMSHLAARNVGFAAIGIGILAIGLFWVPFAGSFVALFGLAGGLIGLFGGWSHRDAAVGLAWTGAGLSFVGLAFGGYWTYSTLNKPAEPRIADVSAIGSIRESGASSREASAEGEAAAKAKLTPSALADKFAAGACLAVVGGDTRDDRDPLKFAAGAYRNIQANISKSTVAGATGNMSRLARGNAKAGRPTLIYGGGANGELAVTTTTTIDGPASDSTPADKSSGGSEATPDALPIQWAAAEKNEPQGSGSLQVTVSKVMLGRVITYPIGDLDTLINVTSEPYLTVWLRIKNFDAAGSSEYRGWTGRAAEDAKIESRLIDDHGREHKRVVPFNKDETIRGTVPAKPVFAGHSSTDALVFRPLPADVEFVELTLSGRAIGQDEDLHFRIPSSMIKIDDTNPLLGGPGN